jgi:DNA excision repair protein ERCC-4
MTDGSVTVLADRNEPMRVRMLSLNHPDVTDWGEAFLDAADLVVNGVGFERKTPSDFAASMTEDRLDEQVEKLGEAYDHAYILLEGCFGDFDRLGHSSLNPQSARGKAASITARNGIPVIPTADVADASEERDQRVLVDMAVRLGRKHTEEPSSNYLASSAVGSDEPAGKRMWGCLDGIGPSLAEKLWERFGSPAWVWYDHKADESAYERLQEVSGIGERRASSILEELGERPEGAVTLPGADP